MVAMVMEKGILSRGDIRAEAWGTGEFRCTTSHVVSKLRFQTFEIQESRPPTPHRGICSPVEEPWEGCEQERDSVSSRGQKYLGARGAGSWESK